MGNRNVLISIWKLRTIWMTIIAFCAPLPIIIEADPNLKSEMRCGYVMVVMTLLWFTESIPIPVTALMPVFLFPLLGVAVPRDVSMLYITDTFMLYFGGMMLAVAMEEWSLNKRIALGSMRMIGTHPAMLMLGLMLPTWFLSMWISNTAATAMMVPIIKAVVVCFREVSVGSGSTIVSFELDGNQNEPQAETANGLSPAVVECETFDVDLANVQARGLNRDASNPNILQDLEIITQLKASSDPNDKAFLRMAKGFSLCVAYAANMGGIATLTGTPPNSILKDRADALYAERAKTPGAESPITFATYMGFAFPIALLGLILSWLCLCIFFLRGRLFKRVAPASKKAVGDTIKRYWDDMGRMSFGEVVILIIFTLLVLLWLFRAPPNINGWSYPFMGGEEGKQLSYVSDSTPVMLLCVLMFIIPGKIPDVFCTGDKKPSYVPILNWRAVEKKVPWGVLILLGGGFAMAGMSKDSGLSAWVGEKLRIFSDYDPWVMNLVICCISAAATEVTSNAATTTLLLPIMEALALSIGSNPLYLMMGATFSVSFSFMLPVATPPNAIVFSTGWLNIQDMAVVGLVMKVVSVGILTLALNTWGNAMFDLDTLPDLFVTNDTTIR